MPNFFNSLNLNAVGRDYLGVYLNNATSTANTVTTQSPPVQVSQIPSDVTLETLIALVTYRPQVYQGQLLQKYGQNTQIVQSAVTNKLILSNNLLIENLENFVPSNFSGNAIQRRVNGRVLPSNPRELILRGIDPETLRAVRLLQDARRLIQSRNNIQRQLERVEAQINRFAALFNALVNLPLAAASSVVSLLIDRLDKLQATYDALKRVLQLVSSALRAIRDKWRAWKARRKQAKEAEKKAEEIREKITKTPERPRIVLFPKFPKRPRLNWSISDFFEKYKKALANLKNKDGEFYKQAFKLAQDNNRLDLPDPRGVPKINPFTGQQEYDRRGNPIRDRPDAIQRSLGQARQALRNARARLEVAQTLNTAAVEQARQQLIKQIRDNVAVIEQSRKQAIQEYQNAIERRNQIGSRKNYLTESDSFITDPNIDVNFVNIFGDKPDPLKIRRVSDRKVIYKDLSTTQQGSVTVYGQNYGKQYVLVSISERVSQVGENVINKTINVLSTVTTASNAVYGTIYSASYAYGQLSSSLNDKQVATELGIGLVNAANTTNAYAAAMQNVANAQLTSAALAEQAARDAAVAEANAILRKQFEDSVAAGYTGSFAAFSAVTPPPQIYLPILYRVVSNGVRLREQPSLSGPVKQLTTDAGLNLVTEMVQNRQVPLPFISANGYTWGKFKVLSTGEIGWIAINLVTPRISLTGTP